MRPTRVTTETDIPAVFHIELAEAAEAGAAVKVGGGISVGFKEGVSDDVRRTDDENVGVPGGTGNTTAGSADEDEV